MSKPFRKRPARPADGGFSLVEALVALALFATAALALVQLQSHSVRALADTERRALAEIVAENLLVEATAALAPPDLGARNGATRLGNRDFAWRIEVSPTPDAGTRRVGVAVAEAAAPDAPIARAHTFVTTPTAGFSGGGA